ncbi:MAG: hypothetical protein CL992_00630 [Euryarchaeota archaeon]|nr:hypothetical protein [Euryarchaeota archaeon]
MAEEEKISPFRKRLGAIVLVGSLILASGLIAATAGGQETHMSAYSRPEGTVGTSSLPLADFQVTAMKEDLCGYNPSEEECSDQAGYKVANTISTPMLVNDWLKPHRTLLVIAGPEKPIDNAEADSIYDFVTERGGKVIVAAGSDTAENAQKVASRFGLTFQAQVVGEPLEAHGQTWERCRNLDTCEDAAQRDAAEDQIWSMGSYRQNISSEFKTQICPQGYLTNVPLRQNCVHPVLFNTAATITVTSYEGVDDVDPDDRHLYILSRPSNVAMRKLGDTWDTISDNSVDTENDALMVRIDYETGSGFDEDTLGEYTRVNTTGSIVFVADEEAIANYLWDEQAAGNYGIKEDCEDYHTDFDVQRCWTYGNSKKWGGNSVYFKGLIADMFSLDNDVLNSAIRTDSTNYAVVFDESRHVSSVAQAPFIEALSTVVLVTSDAWLKWLILGNLVLLILLAIMIVPIKENWRHVFDLTRFRERPNKLEPSDYIQRVKESLFTTVRLRFDLTRDEMAVLPPAQVQQMIGDPRLIEFIYGSRQYQDEELQEIIRTIRRWDKK